MLLIRTPNSWLCAPDGHSCRAKSASTIEEEDDSLERVRRTSSSQEKFVEAVLASVDLVPAGRVVTYGDIAEFVGAGGPRQVGHVMALHGAAVSWWRVIRADGRAATGLEDEAVARLRAEGVPFRGDRVDLTRARYSFDERSWRAFP
jgi:alkylated DNA nucleotide flippase Atl1